MRLAARHALRFAVVMIAAAGPVAFAGLHMLKPGQAAETANDGDPDSMRDMAGLPDVSASRCSNRATKSR